MSERIFTLDAARPRRLPRAGVMLAAVVAGAAIGAALHTADSPVDRESAAVHAPIAQAPLPKAQPVERTPRPMVPVALSAAPSPPAAPLLAPQAMPPQPPGLSTMIAPNVHITPLGVPPGMPVEPAGPRPDDSESEN